MNFEILSTKWKSKQNGACIARKKIGWKVLSSREVGQVYYKIAQFASIALRKECVTNRGNRNMYIFVSVFREIELKKKENIF